MTINKPTTLPNSHASAAAETANHNATSSEAQTTPAAPPDPNAAKPGNTAPADDGYKVGYGRPPKDFMFKTGQTSPRKGKKFNKQNHEDMFWKIANEKVSAKMGGRTVQMTRYEACLRKRMELAMSGDGRAQREVLGLYSVMSAAKRGEEIRAAQKRIRAQMEAMFAEQDEIERQDSEAQQANTEAKPSDPAQATSTSAPATGADANKEWRLKEGKKSNSQSG